jgi:hypothetical protein
MNLIDERVNSYPGDEFEWVRVVFSNECDEDGNCPNCKIDYAECNCPGPTQDDLFEYKEENYILWARMKVLNR